MTRNDSIIFCLTKQKISGGAYLVPIMSLYIGTTWRLFRNWLRFKAVEHIGALMIFDVEQGYS